MRINIQPIEKFNDPDGGATLRVHSIFHTIQGEGPLTGHPAIFIRLAGCNLQCPQCDTEYTGDDVQALEVSDIMSRVRRFHIGPRLVVITGGEPFRQNITPLVFALQDEDYQVQVETNGTLPPSVDFPAYTGQFEPKGQGAWIVCSPKAGKINSEIFRLAIAFKYVLNHDSVSEVDGLPILALNHSAKPQVGRPPAWFLKSAIYLQPADVQDEELNKKNLQAVIRSCMMHGYTLQLQTHKILNLE